MIPEGVRRGSPSQVTEQRNKGMAPYYALTFLGAKAQKLGRRRKIRKDRVSLLFLALRALLMPWLLTHGRAIQALFHFRWSLGCETG